MTVKRLNWELQCYVANMDYNAARLLCTYLRNPGQISHSAECAPTIMAVEIGHIRQHMCLTWSQAIKRNIEGEEFDPVLWIEFGVAQWSERLIILVILNELETVENSGPWNKDVTSVEMAANYSVVVTPVYKKAINKGRKRKINIDEWKDVARKSLKEHGKEYTTRNDIVKRAKQPSNCVYAISSKRIQILQAKMKNNGPLTDQRVMGCVSISQETAYQGPLPIKKEKKRDLTHMCEFITDIEFRKFYMDLPVSN
ncbi:hypothetical protein ANN_09290 [Periplaneta americana]|uniref:Uncharacterized protein n=1 Tax=Periplaneta americana TaxID=6978 RepID=A0ABQ8TN03_PERAM|nr:hypothetical protein ANN_09290 [Periplaneta americana]